VVVVAEVEVAEVEVADYLRLVNPPSNVTLKPTTVRDPYVPPNLGPVQMNVKPRSAESCAR
jgi:hypothetical protein